MNATTNTNRTENMNAANMAAGNNNKINDFGQKIGGARKDMYQAANEWAAQLADISAEALTKAGGVSKLLHLPNLEKMTEAGAITADQARAALIIWRGIERKPQGSYKADRWAERTRARLEAVAAVLTMKQGKDNPQQAGAAAVALKRRAEIISENPEKYAEYLRNVEIMNAAADIIRDVIKTAEFQVITAAQWPAEPFTFGNYSVSYNDYCTPRKLRIIGGRYYRGEGSTDPADIVRQLREMTAADAEKAAESRARGPRLGVYHTSDYTRYFIAVENKCEIVLKVCDTYQEAAEAARNERAELLERYEALKSFPALRRSWNRPRVGKEWHAADVTPEQFAAAIPFKGVEFGNWLNQDERAALLNSAFDGFHDLAYLLGIEPAAVALGGCLNFSFATRGHANSAAHFSSCYNTINLNKRNGAGCMAHEWLHAADHFAAVLAGRGRGISWGAQFATEYNAEPIHPADKAARAIITAIKKQDFYTRSKNFQRISGKQQGGQDYFTQPAELAARGFEGVVLYLLNCAGMCSDFLVNLESWKNFEMNDAGHRRDCYPYPSDAEAAALLPYYMDFFRVLFGSCEVSNKAAEGIAAATIAAATEKAEADQRAAEKAEQEARESAERKAARRAEFERRAAEKRAEKERKAAEMETKASTARAAVVEMLTARHFDTIATGYDAASVYAVAHLEGEIYTLCADIARATNEGRAYVDALPLSCLRYKKVSNAKRIICRYMEVRAHHQNAAEMIREELTNDGAAVRMLANCYERYAKPENIEHAAKIYADTMRSREEMNKRAAAAEGTTTKPEAKKSHSEPAKAQNGAPAEGLHLEEIADGVRVIGDDWKDTYFIKKAIKANGAHWNKDAKQWEATDPADVARLRAWFALRDGDSTTNEPEAEPKAPAATLEQPAEITINLCERIYNDTTAAANEGDTVIYNKFKGEEPRRAVVTGYDPAINMYFLECENGEKFATERDGFAVVGPEWLKVGAKVRTRGEYMTDARTGRAVWVDGEQMTVRAIGAEFVELEKRDECGSLCGLQSISTATAADELTPVLYEPAEIEEPAEAEPVAASYDTAEPAPAATFFDEQSGKAERQEAGEIKPAATFETSATAEEQQQADALPFMEKAAILDKIQARIFAPWGDVCRLWLVPFRGALDVWNAWARDFGAEGCERLADWALTAKVGERAECRGLMVQIWERDGQTAAEPTTEPERLKANRETRERLRAAIVAELEAAAVYIYPLNNEMKVFGKVEDADQLYKVQDIARRYSSAKFIHEDRAAVFEFNLPLFFPHYFPTDPAPEPSGKGEGSTLENAGEITAPTADTLAEIISEAKQAEKWSANGKYNYGPIESLRAAAYKHTATVEQHQQIFNHHLAEVPTPETYCVWLLRGYDINVDETQVYCDLRRAFPAIAFKEACKLIADHMGDHQQGSGIAAAMVPDAVLIESTDQDTRRKFMERRKCYTNMIVKWAANGERHPEELRKRYDLDSMTLHALLDWELFYTWESARAARALEYLREVYPEATANDMQRVFMATADGLTSIYG